MKITVIGAGYVGLVTAACLSSFGNEVMCVEKVQLKLDKLRKGISPIYEPGLAEILKKSVTRKKLHFSRNISEGISFADVIFLCVGTPQGQDGHADLSQIEEVSRKIAKYIKSYKLIVEKSTVPVNTHLWVKKTVKRYAKRNIDTFGGVQIDKSDVALSINPEQVSSFSPKHRRIDFDIASNPEFLREGCAIEDFLNPDRIVVGLESKRARQIFEELYRPLTKKGAPLIITTPQAAELIKHASNSFLAMKISYINMIADLCEKVGADITEVANGIGFDKRIGRQFLDAGIGWGGSCFEKDLRAFIRIAEEHGVDFTLLKETEKINRLRRQKFIEKAEDTLWINKNKNTAVWGLAFKPNTDDIREAPAIDIINGLKKAGAHLKLYDPQAMENFKKIFPANDSLKYVRDKYEALKNADALLIITEWGEFKKADLVRMKKLMRLPIIIDGRNIYEPKKMQEIGFEYYSIGR
jgi:UDPglucose 6-dehydrogenase